MNAKELRWGNLVQSKVSFNDFPNLQDIFPKYIAVSPVEIMDCHRNKENWAYEPIPVNDDTLVDVLGFKKIGNHFEKDEITIIKLVNPAEYFIFDVKVEHIHRIQNLWFEHKNVELPR